MSKHEHVMHISEQVILAALVAKLYKDGITISAHPQSLDDIFGEVMTAGGWAKPDPEGPKLATVWDEGRAAGWDDCLVEWQACVVQTTPNPYREDADNGA